jgi:transcription antitermination factor NusG
MPRRERTVLKQLDVLKVESFLPTCESIHLWRNRQRVKIIQPLFPSYLFVRIGPAERSRVLRAPGVVRVIGNCSATSCVADSEIEFLRSDFCRARVQPYNELVMGRRVRITSGPMQNVEGVLIQKRSSWRFVMSVELINQHAAIEVNADELEAIMN